MDDATQQAFEAALARLIEGEPEPGDAELITRMLADAPELLRSVSGILAVDDFLRQQAEPRAEAFVEGVAARIAAEQSDEQFVDRVDAAIAQRCGRRRGVAVWLPWLIAAAACMVAGITWWQGMSQRADNGLPLEQEHRASGDVLALMVSEAAAKFASGQGPDAVSFAKGKYSLLEGAVHLRFRNGADMVVVAPAHFDIDTALEVRMAEGAVRVFAPPSAHGFVISAPGVQYRDLGTEFGVMVLPETGQSKLHVFDGEVEVTREGEKAPKATITEGQSVKMVQGELTATEGPADGQFPTPGEISLRRWQAFEAQFRRDPNLVFYFPFIADPDNPQALTDVAESGAHVTGRIQGAQWVAGRWPGKSALQFEHRGDGVALTIPGQYQQVTLAAWLKVDRFDNAMNIIMSSVGWREGGIQWQMDRLGDPAPTSVYSLPKRHPLWTHAVVPTGRWVYWAVTIDSKTGTILHYINGRLAGEATIAPGAMLRPAAAHIGRWEPDNKAPDIRDFRGRIDDMAMWRVVLSPAQIAQLADAGMPIELPTFHPEANAAAAEKKAAIK